MSTALFAIPGWMGIKTPNLDSRIPVDDLHEFFNMDVYFEDPSDYSTVITWRLFGHGDGEQLTEDSTGMNVVETVRNGMRVHTVRVPVVHVPEGVSRLVVFRNSRKLDVFTLCRSR